MENQHRKISGYRELSQQEIDLMNQFKAKGSELLALHAELVRHLANQSASAIAEGPDNPEHERLKAAEPEYWAGIGKKNVQIGIMALVRAVVQPVGV